MYVTEYLLNTAFEAAFGISQYLDITALVEKYGNYTLTTDNFEFAIPELLAKYGQGKRVDMRINLSDFNQSLCNMTTSGIALDLSLNLELLVANDTAVKVEMGHLQIKGDFNVTNAPDPEFYGNIAQFEYGTFDETKFNTTLNITGDHLRQELQAWSSGQIQLLNNLLHLGIWPRKIFGGIFHDISLDFYDGYMGFGGSV